MKTTNQLQFLRKKVESRLTETATFTTYSTDLFVWILQGNLLQIQNPNQKTKLALKTTNKISSSNQQTYTLLPLLKLPNKPSSLPEIISPFSSLLSEVLLTEPTGVSPPVEPEVFNWLLNDSFNFLSDAVA